MRDLKQVFSEECSHLKVDARWIRKVMQYERYFVNSSEEHIQFLGGYLLGSPPFRFHQSDRNQFFDEIMEVDDANLRDEINSLDSVNPEFKVRSDEFNLSCVYLVYLIGQSNVSARIKHDAQMTILKILHYRFLGSLMGHYIRYEPDRGYLEETYNRLNRKFALKRHGSWGKLIEARCEDILSPRSIHIKAITKFDNDDEIQGMVADVQGRIREVVKKIMRVFIEVTNDKTKVISRSSTIDLEGDLHIRDLSRRFSELKRYAHEVFDDRKTLIRAELIKVIGDAMHTMPERHLESVLEYMSDNHGHRGDKNVLELIDETMLHAFDFINYNHREFSKHISLSILLQRLRALYTSSRSTDPSLLKMRDLSLKIVKKVVKSNNASLTASIRTGLMLYIVLRAFSMRYYTSGGSMEQLQVKVPENVLDDVLEVSTSDAFDDALF